MVTPYESITMLWQLFRLVREKWTDGHRMHFSLSGSNARIEMPSVDLKVFISKIEKRNRGWWRIHSQADLEYISGYWM
jgi:hypothetical protein